MLGAEAAVPLRHLCTAGGPLAAPVGLRRLSTSFGKRSKHHHLRQVLHRTAQTRRSVTNNIRSASAAAAVVPSTCSVTLPISSAPLTGACEVYMARSLETDSSKQQHALELKIAELYQELTEFESPERDEMLLLLRDRHARYLQGGLGELPSGFISLDASRPWICYWILHGLALLEQPLPRKLTAEQVTTFLSSCQHRGGGYGGGPGQMAHLAPTYAAVSALLTLGGDSAYRSINRAKLWDFLCRMAIPPEQGGGFRMHEGMSVCKLHMCCYLSGSGFCNHVFVGFSKKLSLDDRCNPRTQKSCTAVHLHLARIAFCALTL